MNVILCGPPFSGKSTVGKALATKLKRPFIDTDELLEQQVGLSKTELYRQVGEPQFRKREQEVLESLSNRTNSVIACGGGMVDPALKSLGSVFYLSVPSTVMWERLIASGRQPAYCHSYDSFLAHISKRLTQFESLADYTIRADRPVEEILEEIGVHYGIK